ncbi:MAG: hypothetical protein OQK35_05570 [Alphaproteobacteria bacterium]|nr:hypothetical protein [Rhodospirillales bacterium]MCW9045783.1 hypothetical protein [Alphaproteobacteria bacterium]
MTDSLGITKDGIDLALKVKSSYKTGDPILVPGDADRILMPEHLLNKGIDLTAFEDPMPLALVSARDPEPPMAVAAALRLSPIAGSKRLINGVFEIIGETTKHQQVKTCIDMVTESDFNPQMINKLHGHAAQFIARARKQYTDALRANLSALMDGDLAPKLFVHQFFELTEAGNLRSDIRKKLVCSLLLSKTIRPGIKFLFLENISRFPQAVRHAIISDLLKAPNHEHIALIKEELRWIAGEEVWLSSSRA